MLYNAGVIKHTSLEHLQKLTFALVVFFLPSNLFLKLATSYGYVNGILVDYLIPKLYLSDFFILGLLALWIIEKITLTKTSPAAEKTLTPKNESLFAKLFFALGVFLSLHLLLHLSSPFFISTFWFSIKLLQMSTLFGFLYTHTKILHSKQTYIALATMIIFQSVLAISQYALQRPIFGYRILGESELRVSPLIAKTKYFDGLKLLPYGTTPHPNVLAGILTISLLLSTQFAVFQKAFQKKFVTLAFWIVGTATILLTQSLVSLLALFSAILIFLTKSLRSSRKLFFIGASITVALAILIPVAVSALSARTSSIDPNNSIERRAMLQEISLKMFFKETFAGAGLNQFTTQVNSFGGVPAPIRFLQPVHNVGLLWFAETGLLGVVLVATTIFLFKDIGYNLYSGKTARIFRIIIPLIILSSLDHYLFSLQQGQLLATISLAFLLSKKEM